VIGSQAVTKLRTTRPPGALIAPFLAGLAVVSALVGIADSFGPIELSARVTAALLILAATIMGIGAAVLFSCPKGEGLRDLRALLAFLATVVAALVLLLFALTDAAQPISTPGVGVAAGVGCAVAIWFAVRLWNAGGLNFTEVVARGAPRVLTTVIGVGTIVGFGQFWYQNVYLPSVAHPGINLTAKLDMDKGFARHRRAVYATLTLTNPTQREVTILATHFEVLGRPLEKRLTGDQRGEKVLLERDRPAGRQVRTGRRTVLRSGEILPTGSFLVPGEETTRRIAVAVPRRHRAVVFNSYVIIARDRVSPDLVSPERQLTHQDTRSVHRSFDIVEDSVWRQLTRGDRELYTMETLGAGSVGYRCPGFPEVQAYIDSYGKHPMSLGDRTCTEDATNLAKSYDLATARASTELLLPHIEP
jgi:hypothetical protein